MKTTLLGTVPLFIEFTKKVVHYVFYTGALSWFCLLCIMMYHAYLSVKVLSSFFSSHWNCLHFFH